MQRSWASTVPDSQDVGRWCILQQMGDTIRASDTSQGAAGDSDLSSVWRSFGPRIGLVFRTLVLGAM